MANASSETTRLVLLGTGTPNGEPERSGPSAAVVIGEKAFLFDFGPGIVRQAAAACTLGIGALEPRRLRRAFLTHLHSDHTAGYPDLILTPWTLGREEPLSVFGPRGLRTMTDAILSAYVEDIRERLEGPEPANGEGYRVLVTEIEPGVAYEEDGVSIEAFPTNHGSWPAFGYRVTSLDRVIVLSGDTAPFEGWEKAYTGCDVLLHEVQSAVGLAARSKAWQTYHRKMHTTSEELAAVASVARPDLLILDHCLLHGVAEEALLDEVRRGYDGDVVLGYDLDIF